MIHFVAPAGWPTGPAGWLPPADWMPEEYWPPPPHGWVFYVDEYGSPADAGPYHWDPEAWLAEAFVPAAQLFPEYTPPPASDTASPGGSSLPATEGPHGSRSAPTVLAAVVVLIAVSVVVLLVLRPERPNEVPALLPSAAPVTLPAPQDLLTAALTSLGFACITERAEPTMVGCRQGDSDNEMEVVRAVLDSDDEVVTFQMTGPLGAGGLGGDFQAHLAVVLQMSTDDPRVDVLTNLDALRTGKDKQVDLDWGTIQLAKEAGATTVTGIRQGDDPGPQAVKGFPVTADQVTEMLRGAGMDCETAGKTRTACDGVVIIRDGIDLAAIELDPVEHEALLPNLASMLTGPGVAPELVETVTTVGARGTRTAESIAGHLVEKTDDGVRIGRVEGWW